jgi:hypothetical protein
MSDLGFVLPFISTTISINCCLVNETSSPLFKLIKHCSTQEPPILLQTLVETSKKPLETIPASGIFNFTILPEKRETNRVTQKNSTVKLTKSIKNSYSKSKRGFDSSKQKLYLTFI